jgi:pimeloyl-[acyl-carrier protein] synthase
MASGAPAFPAEVDPTLPGHPDPYPLYRQLRETDPVHWSPFMNGWVLTRHGDAADYLRDHRFSRVAYLAAMRAKFGGGGPILKFQSGELSFLDPPEHSWLKNVVAKAFSPQRIAAMRPHIQASVDAMLARAAGAKTMDVVADLGYPLPADVIAKMIGVPPEDWPSLREWVDGIVISRGVVRTPAMMAAGDRAAENFEAYLRELIARRRAKPADDLMSALIDAEEKDRRMSDDQIVIMCETLFAAGHATTRNLIGNGVLTLLNHEAELTRLRDEPDLIESCVEEVLRFDPPTQAPSPQLALEDVDIGGRRIRKGEAVSVLFGAANRDPARFADPDRFDIARTDNEHFSFSFGIHYCLGASLARAEAQIAIATLIRRMPRLRLATGDLKWQKMGRFRGLESLIVEF